MNKRKIQNSAVIAAALSASLVSLYTNTDWLSEKTRQESLNDVMEWHVQVKMIALHRNTLVPRKQQRMVIQRNTSCYLKDCVSVS